MASSYRDLKLEPPYRQLLPSCIALWVGIISTSTAEVSRPVFLAVYAVLVTTSVIFLRRGPLHLATGTCAGIIALLYLLFVAPPQIVHTANNTGTPIAGSVLGALLMVLPWHHEPARRNGFLFVISLCGAFVLGTTIGYSVRTWGVVSNNPVYTALTSHSVSPDNGSVTHDPGILLSIVTTLSFAFVFVNLLIVLFGPRYSGTQSKSADWSSRSQHSLRSSL